MSSITYRGTPRTAEEWAALAKIASAQSDISKETLRRLFMLGLVHRQFGRVCLTEHGRSTLRLPDRSAVVANILASDVG